VKEPSTISIPPGALESLPILVLRDAVLFPASVLPVNVGRPRSVRLVEKISEVEKPTIGVFTQFRPETENPDFSDIHAFGTLSRVLKLIRLNSGNFSVVLQGIARIRMAEPLGRDPFLRARVERLQERWVRDEEIDALAATVREAAREAAENVPQIPRELKGVLEKVRDPGALADLVASHLPVVKDQKQSILETLDLRERLRAVLDLVRRQAAVHKVKKEIDTIVREGISRSQRELLLRQQLRAIRRELGDGEDEDDEIELLRERIAKAEPPPEVEKVARRELSRMNSMNPQSAEYQVSFGYLSWLADVPWSAKTSDLLDIAQVRRVLDEDHYGLEKAKKRIVEFMAVRKLASSKKGPILCIVGPPGVGKSSLGRSIARATGRKCSHISLGGVQDEAEIRGHRRTYVGALPGRLIAGLKKAGSINPVFILDEVDKMGVSYQGDPAAALLEALDPEQNHAFEDHYLDVPVDLSQVFFVATANRQDKIPTSLLDRMEVIELPGYMRNEKIEIAKQFLVPRQLSEHGLTPEHLEVSDEAVGRVVDEYTDESGVRQLERMIGSLCREVAVRIANGESVYAEADDDFIEKVLGPPKHEVQTAETSLAPGVSNSLTWTPAGGQLLLVECSQMPGKGKVFLTGSMGEVMKESANAAFTYLRSRAEKFSLDGDFLSKIDVHVHLPKGGIPKDGPAAGLSIVVSLLSMLRNASVRPDMAVTGEITLMGTVLRVQGLKQKCLAAHRANIKHVVLPKANEPELEEIPKEIRTELNLHLISRIEEAFPLVFT
jgi:ATP-dependent Lon protease